MSEKTHIAWCDSTVNFWEGCDKISPGCAHCYAEARDKRQMIEKVIHWGKGAPRRKSKSAVAQALAMNRRPFICDNCGNAQEQVNCGGCEKCRHSDVIFHRRRIFSLSLGDWLDDEVPIEWLAEMLDTIRQCSDVTWMLCSKRWEDFKKRFSDVCSQSEIDGDLNLCHWAEDWMCGNKIPTNIIGLCSVENQEWADKRIPMFLKVPLACRGLSLEPLLGPVDLTAVTDAQRYPGALDIDVLNGREIHHDDNCNWTPGNKVDWTIIGGESGPNARPCNVEWIRNLVRQSQAAGVTTFVKQLGSHYVNAANIRAITLGDEPMRDKKGGAPSEWSPDLRVQQWPKGF